jgi:hypothetical protein
MLDEAEWAELAARYDRATGPKERLMALLEEYERLTGFHETNPNAVWHHRVSLYGPACSACGKPLRTPRAAKCMACGAPRVPPTSESV